MTREPIVIDIRYRQGHTVPMSTTPTTRIAAGLYSVTINGHHFRIEKTTPSQYEQGWHLFEETASGEEYWNTYLTKREAVESLTDQEGT